VCVFDGKLGITIEPQIVGCDLKPSRSDCDVRSPWEILPLKECLSHVGVLILGRVGLRFETYEYSRRGCLLDW